MADTAVAIQDCADRLGRAKAAQTAAEHTADSNIPALNSVLLMHQDHMQKHKGDTKPTASLVLHVSTY